MSLLEEDWERQRRMETVKELVGEPIEELAQRIWDYHHVGHTLQPADAIFVLGSHDTRVADYAVDLYQMG